MTTLLRLDVSARGSASVSRAVADTFEQVWRDRLADAPVVSRDLSATAIPHLAADVVPRSVGLEVNTPAARFQDALVDELVDADALIVSTPMYNLGVPSVLKAWIDHVILLGRTLNFHDGVPTAGVPATIVTAYGGGYGPGSPREGWDHVRPHLEAVFGGILNMDVEVIGVELTLAATTPGMEALVEMAEHSLAQGHRAAAERAVRVAAAVGTRMSRPAAAS